MPTIFPAAKALTRLLHGASHRSRSLARWILFVLAVAVPAPAAGLAEQISEILGHEAASRAFWGIKIAELESGQTVYEYNADKLFVLASNAKLFSTALGLVRLGPQHTYTTSVVVEAPPAEDGVVPGDLILLGGGDPNLSSRVIPYDPDKDFEKNLLRPITDLAQQVVDAGIRRIEGNVVGDDTRYVWQRHPPGWSMQDGYWAYGAPISALSFNDNMVKLRVLPGTAPRQLARVDVTPKIEYFSLDNRARTAPTRTVARGLGFERQPGSRKLLLWGDISIRSRGRVLSVAVDDPALFAALALQGELKRLGVTIDGAPVARHAHPHEFPSLKRLPNRKPKAYAAKLAAVESAPLAQTLPIINKDSQNLHAEMLLCEVGYRRRGVGSFEAGLAELKSFLVEAGLRPQESKLQDASGLSRRNLVTPGATTRLLTYMWNSPSRENFVSSLPVSGEDGTLDWRFARTSAKGRIRAKTGSLAHVTAISGYATALDGRHLAFSILVNNYGVQASYIRSRVDKICVAMVTSAPAREAPTKEVGGPPSP